MENIRIADLVLRVSFSDVCEKLRLHYGEKGLPQYEELYFMLGQKAVSFAHSDNFTIYINAFRVGNVDDELLDDFDENDPSLDFDVSAYVENDETVYSIAGHSYDEFLGCMVDQDTLKKFSPENILAHCLYEITFYGFEDNV